MTHRDNVGLSSVSPQDNLTTSLQERILILEGQLRASEAAYLEARSLLQHAPNVAFLLTSEGRVLNANLRACTLLASTPEDLLGRRLSRFMPPTAARDLIALLKQAFSSSKHHTGELQLLAPDGSFYDMAAEVVLCKDQGVAPCCHLTLTDITVFKEAYRNLLDTTASLDRKLQDQAARLRLLNEEFSDVVTASNTQVQEHLVRAQNFLTLHHREWQSEQPLGVHLSTAQQVLQACQGVLNSVDQYMHARQLRIRLRSVNLNQVLAEVQKDLRDQMEGREVQVTSAALPVVQGDSQALQLILREYLSNALKFTRTREKVQLRIHAEETATAYLIGVEDNGVGFNMRQRDKLFELFQRLHPGGSYEGVGLGLAVVRQLCERFGGRAWGEGKVNQGATFWFTCPKEPQLLA